MHIGTLIHGEVLFKCLPILMYPFYRSYNIGLNASCSDLHRQQQACGSRACIRSKVLEPFERNNILTDMEHGVRPSQKLQDTVNIPHTKTTLQP